MNKTILLCLLLIGALFLTGCREEEYCKQISIDELGTAGCDKLTISYKCYSRKSGTVFARGNCDTRYIPLIKDRCEVR